MDAEHIDLESRVGRLEDDSRRNTEQHKEFYAKFSTVATKMAVGEEKQAQIMKMLNELKSDINDLKVDINDLKIKPAKRWDTIVTSIITTLTGGLVGAMLALLIKV